MGKMETTQELANTFFVRVLCSDNLTLWVSHSIASPSLEVFPPSDNTGDYLGGIFCLLPII